MARPVDANATRTRNRILDSACDAFATRGADGSSIRAIARAAGVSVAMVHHYFGSKDELYDACIDAMYEKLVPLAATLEERLKDGLREQVVDNAVRTGFRFGREHQTAVRLLNRQVMETGALDPERRARAQAPLLELAAQRLGPAIGAASPATTRLAAQSVVMLVARYASSSLDELRFFTGSDGTDEDVLDVVEDHLAMIAQAILNAG